MDPLTHAISGAVLARALPNKPLPNKQVFFIILLTMAPDADIILRLFSDTLYLQHHRGITHSLLLLPLWSWMIYSLCKQRSKQAAIMPWLIGLALLLHISLDLITTFGTMILAPFSDWRASLDLLFIIDPLFTACLLLPLLAGFIWTQHTRKLGVLSLALMCSYLALAYSNQQQAIALTKTAHPNALKHHALPLAFSPFNWQLIAEYPDHYARAAINLKPAFDGTRKLFDEAFITGLISSRITGSNNIAWQQWAAMHTLSNIDSLPGTKFYSWFARYPVILKKHERSLEFGDLAFGAGADGVQAPFILRVELNQMELNQTGLNQVELHQTELNQTTTARSWLIWRANRKTELTHH